MRRRDFIVFVGGTAAACAPVIVAIEAVLSASTHPITSGLRSERGRGKTILMPSSGVRREKHAHTFLRVLSKLFRTRDRAVAEQHRAVERRRHNQPIKLGCREQRIENRKSPRAGEPFECRRKRCNRPPGASGIECRTKFWKASYLADHEPAQLQDPGSENDFELSDRIADQVALSVGLLAALSYTILAAGAGFMGEARCHSGEQRLLVRKVSIDGLVRSTGEVGDLVHARAEIAAAK